MKQLLTITYLVLLPFAIYCQTQVEIKLEMDGFKFLKNNTYQPSIEVLLNQKYGLDLELGFLNSEFSFPGTRYNGFIRSKNFVRKEFRPSIGVKYYFLFNKNSNGLFLGPYFRLNFITHLGEGTNDALQQAFNLSQAELENFRLMEGLDSFNYGINIGYKWVFFSRLIVEPLFIISALNKPKEELSRINSSDGDMFIRVGFRF